jgi:hypothetical protein
LVSLSDNLVKRPGNGGPRYESVAQGKSLFVPADLDLVSIGVQDKETRELVFPVDEVTDDPNIQ